MISAVVSGMSAEVGSGYLTLASRLGALAVLQKPFTQETLLETIAIPGLAAKVA